LATNTNTSTHTGDESSLEKLQKEFEDKFGAIPPTNKKNDVEWLSKKLLEINS